MAVTDAQKAAMRKYDKKTKQFVFRLRLNADADVIERLETVPQRTEYLRRLVRRDIRGR